MKQVTAFIQKAKLEKVEAAFHHKIVKYKRFSTFWSSQNDPKGKISPSFAGLSPLFA